MIIVKILSVSTAKEITNVIFENLRFKKTIAIPKIGSVPLYAMIQKGSGEFEIVSGDEIVVTGKVTVPAQGDKFLIDSDLELLQERIELTGSDVYNEFSHRGQKFSGLFKSIKSLSLTEEGSKSVVQWNGKWTLFLEAMIQQVLFPEGEKYQNIMVPNSIQKIAFSLPLLPTDNKKGWWLYFYSVLTDVFESCLDVEVIFDYYTGIVGAEGIQICGLAAKPLPVENRPISFDSVEYISLVNGNYKVTVSVQ